MLILTDHARMRMQQRGIQQSQIEWLLEFGSERYDRCGKLWLHYDHKAKKLMRKYLSGDILKRKGQAGHLWCDSRRKRGVIDCRPQD